MIKKISDTEIEIETTIPEKVLKEIVPLTFLVQEKRNRKDMIDRLQAEIAILTVQIQEAKDAGVVESINNVTQ